MMHSYTDWLNPDCRCQPPERDGDRPQPGGGGARAGRPGLRGHVPGGHTGQARQIDAQGARPCCLSTICHLIPRPFIIRTMTVKLMFWNTSLDASFLGREMDEN